MVHCPKYCLTGRCERRGADCPYAHDPVKRAVCPRWLHGRCAAGASCPLQHQRRPELMPTCLHFLRGKCTAAACPYLHVNLSPGAPACAAFLRGHCPAGVSCPHKHFTLAMVRQEKRLDGGRAAAATRGQARRGAGAGAVLRALGGDAGSADPAKPTRRGKRRYFDEPGLADAPSSPGGSRALGPRRRGEGQGAADGGGGTSAQGRRQEALEELRPCFTLDLVS
eukprot:scaffold26.g3334.t1